MRAPFNLWISFYILFHLSILAMEMPPLSEEIALPIDNGAARDNVIEKLDALEEDIQSTINALENLRTIIMRDWNPTKNKNPEAKKKFQAASELFYKYYQKYCVHDLPPKASKLKLISVDLTSAERNMENLRALRLLIENETMNLESIRKKYLYHFGLYQKHIRLNNSKSYISHALQMELNDVRFPLWVDLLRSMEPLVGPLRDDQKIDAHYIVTPPQEKNLGTLEELFGAHRPPKRKKHSVNVLQAFVREDPEVFIQAITAKPSRGRPTTTTTRDTSTSRVVDDSDEGMLEIESSSDEEESFPQTSEEPTPKKTKAKKKKPGKGRKGRRVVASSQTKQPEAEARPQMRAEATPIIQKIKLTKDALQTFEAINAPSYPTEVRKQDYQNLIDIFITLNVGPNKLLKKATTLNGKENHTNAPPKSRNGANKVAHVGDGMSFAFIRHDGKRASLNIHYAHGKSAGNNKIPAAYQKEYTEIFRELGVYVEDIEIE